MTAGQIDHALAHGFIGIDADPRAILDGADRVDDIVRRSLDALGKGRSALVYTARGPDTVLSGSSGPAAMAADDRLGETLSRIPREVLERSGIKRAVVAGGDTSSHAVRQLGLQALRFAGHLATGSPLCLTIIREALDEAVRLGVPQEATRDFVLGHLDVEIAIDEPGGRVVIMDSITKVTPDDEGSIVVAASHGGASSGEFALEVPLRLVILNDAGIASLAMLDECGVTGATVSHTSARIGDALDIWTEGTISRVDISASTLGFREGAGLQQAIQSLLSWDWNNSPAM